ncbi:hypothetical protein BDV95DRAFT_606539 [Massariosphaeria phaeospora]|uniref:Uncharacterized protein n=1 Tax=Massariosphaeria phaeospora TaxID=100035 RepID=A0A7C8I6H7_9PLEO|nr:hypothetical protein BDV95DRAFT_606539 [Massariosphaeria phaeospora]
MSPQSIYTENYGESECNAGTALETVAASPALPASLRLIYPAFTTLTGDTLSLIETPKRSYEAAHQVLRTVELLELILVRLPYYEVLRYGTHLVIAVTLHFVMTELLKLATRPWWKCWAPWEQGMAAVPAATRVSVALEVDVRGRFVEVKSVDAEDGVTVGQVFKLLLETFDETCVKWQVMGFP